MTRTKFTRVDVRELARRAHLELSSDELEIVAAHLVAMLESTERLSNLPTQDVEETRAVGQNAAPRRADAPRESLPRDVALSGGAWVEDGRFVVPVVIAR